MPFHPLLKRQLKRFNIDLNTATNLQWRDFFEHISKIYHDNDQDRYTIERSLDISSQEMMELRQKLQKEKELLQAVVSEGICVLDQHLQIVSINDTAANLLNCLPEEVKGKSCTEVFNFYSEESSVKHKIHLNKISYNLANSKYYARERANLETAQGVVFPVSFSFNPIITGNPLLFEGAVLVFKDISEQVRSEQALRNALMIAEQSSKAKALFLATMSHEIRTPLHGILGMLHILQNTPLNADQKTHLEKSIASANTLLEILGDILDFTKIETSKVNAEEIGYNLREELKTLITPLTVQCQKKNLQLILNYDDKIPSTIFSDPLRLKQIINNIVKNAIKFTPSKGKIIIDVILAAQEKEAAILKIAISDNGIGIPLEAQEKIFEVFSQADDSITRQYGGTGLGLSIVKQLLIQMGGDITVKSTEGAGSTFTVILKVGYKKEAQEAVPFHVPSRKNETSSKRTDS